MNLRKDNLTLTICEVYHCYHLFLIPKSITGSSDKLLQYPMTLRQGTKFSDAGTRGGGKDPYLHSLTYILWGISARFE